MPDKQLLNFLEEVKLNIILEGYSHKPLKILEEISDTASTYPLLFDKYKLEFIFEELINNKIILKSFYPIETLQNIREEKNIFLNSELTLFNIFKSLLPKSLNIFTNSELKSSLGNNYSKKDFPDL